MGFKKIRIDEKTYKTIKLMLKGGASLEEIQEFKPISYETMRRIKRTDDYQGYLALQRKYLENRNLARGTERQQAGAEEQTEEPQTQPETVLTDDRQKGGTISANYQVNRIYELLKKQNETLTLISNKLAFIVDELTK